MIHIFNIVKNFDATSEFRAKKESFLKLTGEGLRDNMKDVLSGTNEVSLATEINRPAGYVYSIAYEKPACRDN